MPDTRFRLHAGESGPFVKGTPGNVLTFQADGSSVAGEPTDPSPPPPEAALTVFVSKAGSDVTGNGSYTKPFASINAACSLIRSFGNASSTVRYVVHVGAGSFTEALELSTWTYVVGSSAVGTHVAFTSLTLGPEWTGGVQHRAGFQNMSVSGAPTVDFNAVSADQAVLRFDQVTFEDKWTYTAFSNLNAIVLNDCFLLDAYVQNGHNVYCWACTIQGTVVMQSISDGRALWTLSSFIGTGLDAMTQAWIAGSGSNESFFQCNGMTGHLTLNGAQARVLPVSNPIAFPGGVTLLNGAPDPRINLTGSKGGNVALASVCTGLAQRGGYLDSTT